MKPKHQCPNCECGKPWKPKDDDFYFAVENDGNITKSQYLNDSIDRERLSFGNVFRTATEAQSAAEKVKKLLLSLRN